MRPRRAGGDQGETDVERISAHLDEARTAVLDGTLDPDDARTAYEAGLARSAVAERLHSTGLSGFDRTAQERSIARFTDASRAVRELLVSLLPQRVLAGRGFDCDLQQMGSAGGG